MRCSWGHEHRQNGNQDVFHCRFSTGTVELRCEATVPAEFQDVRGLSVLRSLSSGPTGTVTVPLIKPDTVYADRSMQLDVRITKRFNIGRVRIEANLDIFNVLNASGVQVHNNNFGSGWLQPRLIQLPRYVMLGAQLNF